MNDAKTMGSLEEKLMSYVSTHSPAGRQLRHCSGHADPLRQAEKSVPGRDRDLCYVSKASISRFCRFMGFDGFRELHDCLRRIFLSERIIPGPFTTNCVPTRRQPCRITARK